MLELTPAEWEALQLSLKVAFWSVVAVVGYWLRQR